MKNIVRTLILSVCLLSTVAAGADDKERIGEGNDGNRSGPVHHFELFDEAGMKIRAEDESPNPFSLKKTCGECHDYEKIAAGWHFNGHNPEVDPGRPGQPWVLTDSRTRTQIPLSGRGWEGTFTPEQLGVTPWEFVKKNFSHFPGGSYGEMAAEDVDDEIRQNISGMYEINCLTCHHRSYKQDHSLAALQAGRQNYRWIAAASSGKAEIKGVALSLDDFFDPEFDEGIETVYDKNIFDSDDKVFFDIGMPSNDQCYFCHSNQNLGVTTDDEWTRDEDVHLQSGLNCIDCHRNGDDHMITRGIETDGPGKSLTCEGCHVDEHGDSPELGRLGAPKPAHRGIPTIHFEKLTCTACHSGPWPTEEVGRWKTARIHKTGLHGKHNLDITQPHVYAPVLMKGADEKIGPYKIFWPAYWATVEGETLTPLAPKDVMDVAGKTLKAKVEKVDDWRPLTEAQITDVLKAFSDDEQTVVYVAGGKKYQLNGETLDISEDDAAKPYAWPMAHDVRPAEQGLGVRLCKDCHTTDSAFFFGKVQADSPVQTEGGPEMVEMIQLQGIDRLYMWMFNASFVFRPMLKIVAFASCGLIALVVLAYFLRAVAAISNACKEEVV